MKILITSQTGFAIDTQPKLTKLGESHSDGWVDCMTPLYHLALTGEEVRVLSESDYQAILSLLPKDCPYPTKYNESLNVQRYIQESLLMRNPSLEYILEYLKEVS